MSASTSGPIVIVGASGFVGKPTVHALEKVVGAGRIKVVTRNTGTPVCCGFAAAGCLVEYGDMNDVDSLTTEFKGASAVYLITPGAENRAELMKNALKAAKAANVPFVLVLSVCTADNKRTIFGKQYSEIEKATKDCGIPYTIMRVPMFTDNLLTQVDSIRKGKLASPMNPDARHTTIAVEDCAAAAAAILTRPAAHRNKTYTFSGHSWCNSEAAAALETAVDHPVACEQWTYEEAERQYNAKGWWEPWQVKGTLELMHLCDDGRYVFASDDFHTIVGRDAMTVQQWITSARPQLRASAH